jgi:hypothetical protein
MNVRETGTRRIRYVTRGLTIAGVAGSLVFAGVAKSATESERAKTTGNQPSSSSSSGTDSGTGTDSGNGTSTNNNNSNDQNSQPPVTNTDQLPQITSGGS